MRASAPASAASGSPRTVSRGSSVNRCSFRPGSSASGASASNASASAARPAVAGSGVSAAIAATGAPAHAGSSVRRASPFMVSGPSGPITARTPGRRARGVEVEPRDAAARDRRAQDECVQHPGELDVDRVAGRAARPHRPVLARRRRADDLQLGLVGPRLDLVLLVDERPDVLEAPLHLALRLDEPRLHAAPAPTRGGSRARSSDRRRSGRGSPPSPRGSPHGSARGSPRAGRSPRRSGPACRSRTGARPRSRTPPGALRRHGRGPRSW